MADNRKRKGSNAGVADEPGFFSDHGYGKGTAITIIQEPAKPTKDSKSGGKAKNRKRK